MSSGLIGAQDAEQQESGVKEPSAGSSRRPPLLKQARRPRKPPQTAGQPPGKLPTQWNRTASSALWALDHIGRRYDPHRTHLLAVELGAAWKYSRCAHLVLSAGADDPRSAGSIVFGLARHPRRRQSAIRRIHPGGVYRFIAYWRRGSPAARIRPGGLEHDQKSWVSSSRSRPSSPPRRVRWCAGCL